MKWDIKLLELILAQFKSKFAEKNKTFETANLKRLLDEATGNVTVDD